MTEYDLSVCLYSYGIPAGSRSKLAGSRGRLTGANVIQQLSQWSFLRSGSVEFMLTLFPMSQTVPTFQRSICEFFVHCWARQMFCGCGFIVLKKSVNGIYIEVCSYPVIRLSFTAVIFGTQWRWNMFVCRMVVLRWECSEHKTLECLYRKQFGAEYFSTDTCNWNLKVVYVFRVFIVCWLTQCCYIL